VIWPRLPHKQLLTFLTGFHVNKHLKAPTAVPCAVTSPTPWRSKRWRNEKKKKSCPLPGGRGRATCTRTGKDDVLIFRRREVIDLWSVISLLSIRWLEHHLWSHCSSVCACPAAGPQSLTRAHTGSVPSAAACQSEILSDRSSIHWSVTRQKQFFLISDVMSQLMKIILTPLYVHTEFETVEA